MNQTKTCHLKNNDQKEEFCGACAAIPLAFVGVGATYGSTKGSNKKMKKILLCSGIFSVILTILIAIYFLRNCSDCR